MHYPLSCFFAGVFVLLQTAQADPVRTLEADGWSATVDAGTLTGLTGPDGRPLWEVPSAPYGPGVVLDEKTLRAALGDVRWGADGTATAASFAGVDGLRVNTRFTLDAQRNELVVEQEASSPQPGLAGVEWSVGPLPLESKIIVPAGGGTQIDADTPERVLSFNYPMFWEAQLAIVQITPDKGFYLWSEDSEHCFKRLQLVRTDEGWMMNLTVYNYAPFDALTTARTPPWRVGVYEGDWRVPAKAYRDWRDAFMHPLPFARQQPSWVANTRVQVLNDGDTERLEALAKQLDPSQVLLYILHWRKQEFDRDYPEYSEFAQTTLPMIKRAHELGFRVMLHVNHFSVTDTHPSFREKYADVITRSPFGQHEMLAYKNTRIKLPIVNYYVNPASRAWREDFVGRMKELVELSGVDALHLDQNVHVHNDYNGLIDGMTYVQGVQALHREMREALPQVALCGEGVNELTFPYLSFAQRTVWSAMRGTIDRSSIGNGHPVSAYLFRPYVKFVGWPGYPSGYEQPQLYAAWWEDYRSWGVIPSIKVLRRTPDDLLEPQGFFEQQMDEARFWTENRVDQDVDGRWPPDVAFPFITADGRPVYRMKDRSTLCAGEEISRTLSDNTATDLPGHVEGWLFYNKDEIFGLNPVQWYPYFKEPRDLSAFHIEQLPEGVRPVAVTASAASLLVELEADDSGVLVDLGSAPGGLSGGLRDTSGQETLLELPIEGRSNASLLAGGGVLRLTPPGTAPMDTDAEGDLVNKAQGLGEVFARCTLTLPEQPAQFLSEVGMDGRAEKKSDGMDFTVVVSDGEQTATKTVFTALGVRQPLNLELGAFAGREVTVTLLAGAGPANDATKDQGLWYHPRIVTSAPGAEDSALAFVSGKSPWRWLAVDGELMEIAQLPQEGDRRLASGLPTPDCLLFLAQPPFPAEVPGFLDEAPVAYTVMDRYGYVEGERGGLTLPRLSRAIVPAGSVARVDIPLSLQELTSPVVVEIDLSLAAPSPQLKLELRWDGHRITLHREEEEPGSLVYRSEPVDISGCVGLLSLTFDAKACRNDVTLASLEVLMDIDF
jgi:hypothetical protein